MQLIEHEVRDVASLGALVREARKRQGLTQVALGELCSAGPRFVGELERGKSTVHMGKVFELLEVLGLRVRIQTIDWADESP